MKLVYTFLLFALLSMTVVAQDEDPAVLEAQRNFARAGLSEKITIVESAARAGSAYGPVFVQALDFALRNVDLLRDDAALHALAAEAARAAGATGYASALQPLRRVFMGFRESSVRVAAIRSLAVLGKGDSQVVESLNQFLANQNNLARSGLAPDLGTLAACVAALAELGDASSYQPLFSTMIAAYPGEISLAAAEAMRKIRGDYRKFLIDVVRKNPPAEKVAAFRIGMENPSFNPAERGELAESALEISLGLYPTAAADRTSMEGLRYAAVRELTVLRWSRATTLAIKHFYRVQTDYGNAPELKERFIEAVECLGAMASSEAAQALSLHLGLVNADMERSGAFDPEILSAVIGALGDLGDKVAFDYLLYIGYLSYPDAVKTAAREAMNRLKW